jgi:hypothetical protein
LYINRDLIPDLHHRLSAGAMRTFSNQLTRIIRDSGLRLNTISKTSGKDPHCRIKRLSASFFLVAPSFGPFSYHR